MDIYICMVRKYIVAHSPTDPLRMNNGQAFEYKNTNSLSSPALASSLSHLLTNGQLNIIIRNPLHINTPQ